MAQHYGTGKIALIIGGSSGIGFALAKLLHQRGMKIVLLARRIEVLEQAKEKLLSQGTGTVTIVSADIARLDSLKQAASLIRDRHPQIDLLVNSAGIVKPGCLGDLSCGEIAENIQINLQGLILSTKIFLPQIPDGGTIVNLSSALGFLGMAGYTVYTATKFGIYGFSDALRRELFSRKISVHIVFPPDVDTPMLRQELSDMPEWMRRDDITYPHNPEKIALKILIGLDKRKFLILPSFQVKLLYFLQYHFPRLCRLIIDRFAPKP